MEYVLPVDRSFFDAFPGERYPDRSPGTYTHHDYPAVDFGNPGNLGMMIYAVTGGVVAHASDACGNGVTIAADDGYTYTYCHGETRLVGPGQRVRIGESIMTMGYSGNVEPEGTGGTHLHFAIRTPSGQLICPQPFLREWYEGRDTSPRDTSRHTTSCIH